MRNKILILISLVCLLPVLASADLIQNGGFEDSLNFWSVTCENSEGSWSVTRDAGYQPDPDYEVQVYKSLANYAQIEQAVDAPTLALRFSASAKLAASTGGTSGYYAYAAVVLKYLSAGGALLGQTMIIKKAGSCNLQNTPTQHLIDVASADWQNYSFMVNDELANLPGVSPSAVAKLAVCLHSNGNGRSG